MKTFPVNPSIPAVSDEDIIHGAAGNPYPKSLDTLHTELMTDPDIVENMDIEDVRAAIESLGFDPASPSMDGIKALIDTATQSLELDEDEDTLVFLESPGGWSSEAKAFAIEQIAAWIGCETLGRILPITPLDLFNATEKSRMEVFRAYDLHPTLLDVKRGCGSLDKDALKNIRRELKIKGNLGSLSLWKLYVDLVAVRSFEKIRSQYSARLKPDTFTRGSLADHLWAWLREIARLPIKKEALQIASRIVSAQEYMSTYRKMRKIQPESILYSVFMMLLNRGLRVLYCGYTIENSPRTSRQYLSWHCGNDLGRRGHYYKRLADKCLETLGREHINSAYFLDSSATGILLPFSLFCMRTASQIIIVGIDDHSIDGLLGIEKQRSQTPAAAVTAGEAIKLSGFNCQTKHYLKIEHRDGAPEVAVSPMGNAVLAPCELEERQGYLKQLVAGEEQVNGTRFSLGAKYFDDLIDVMQSDMLFNAEIINNKDVPGKGRRPQAGLKSALNPVDFENACCKWSKLP